MVLLTVLELMEASTQTASQLEQLERTDLEMVGLRQGQILEQ